VGDREVVASIVAGDSAGVADAYDRYAPALHIYCRSMLREPADAADAVQDTFVIAVSRLGDLRDPDRLKAWLYAVARNVCLRKIRQDKAAAGYAPTLGAPWPRRPADPALADEVRTAAPDPIDVPDPADISDRAERAELRALIRDASGGLTSRDREILRLRLWEELDPDEAGNVLGVTRDYANALFTRAREQLTACLGDLLVARTGRDDCSELRQILHNWDGELTVLLRKRLSRHIERCDTCSGRRRRELVPALLGLSPGAAIAAAAFGRSALPAALKGRVLEAAAAHAAHAAGIAAAGAKGAAAASAAGAAGAFGRNGFPKAAHSGWTRLAHAAHTPAAAMGAAAATTVAAAAVAITLTLPGGPKGHIAGGTPQPSPGQGAASPSPGPRPGSGTPGLAVPSKASSDQGETSPGQGGGPGVALVTSAATGLNSPGPSGSTSSGLSPTSTGSGDSTPPSGTLAVSATTVLLTPLLGSTITLTAEGGPVSWSISEPFSLLGTIGVSPSSGTLAPGESVQVTITVRGLASLDSTLLVGPGNIPVTVLVGLGV
jgi:RNA polymerase sigma factor (sigma-70 family)